MIAFDGHARQWFAGVLVADNADNRLLEYNGPFKTATMADHVFGQLGSFITNTANKGGISANSLSGPGR